LGVARGGTSLVTGVLRRLGIFLGDEVDSSTGEDLAFLGHRGERDLFFSPEKQARRDDYLTEIRNLIAARNATHAVWGWKDPLASFYLREIIQDLPPLVFIVVVRDVAAIAGREHLQEFGNLAENFLAYGLSANEQYHDIFEIVSSLRRPTLVVSYERCLRAPGEFGACLANFVGAKADEKFGAWLDRFIEADRGSGEESAPQGGGFRAGLLGRSFETRILLSESVQLGCEASLALAPGMDDRGMLNECAEALHRGDAVGARGLGLALLQAQVGHSPHLGDGLIGALSVCLIGTPAMAVVPDMACGALYLLGLANIQLVELQTALGYLVAAEAAMRVRLASGTAESGVARANYWGSMFHLGWVAKVLGRRDLVAKVMADFTRLKAGGDGYFDQFNAHSFAIFCQRAESELN